MPTKIALAKLVNSLSWGFDIRNPQPIDADGGDDLLH